MGDRVIGAKAGRRTITGDVSNHNDLLLDKQTPLELVPAFACPCIILTRPHSYVPEHPYFESSSRRARPTAASHLNENV